MTKTKLEIMLREAGKIARDRDFFLFGSQSLRALRPSYPKEFPKSLEADLYPRNHPQAWGLLRQQMGRDSKFFRKHGVYLDCVDPALALFPDGWLERLIPFRTPRTGGVTAWCLEPNDLFVSKLVAWREKDQQFLRAMLKHKLAKPMVVLNRIEDLPISSARRKELKRLVEELVAESRAGRPKLRRNITS
jgi:hypothetical protein